MDTEFTDPCVPTSNQPPKPEWTCHYWYVLRSFALQARHDLDDADAAELVALFANLSSGLPCPKCKTHYRENWAVEPYTLAHAKDPAKGMEWIGALRLRIKEQIKVDDLKEAGGRAETVPPKKYRSCVPRPPKLTYTAMESKRGLTDVATDMERKAHQSALAKTAENRKRGDCGCSAKEPALARPTF